ncbi:LysM peptidoglycan-binding domain-containing protein [Phototrophicus methaneseepsis]|uniref:LysM peptidoglycan-binding domain-containing protein n=1 Tax=Phototrophicus methaneseepsis TaxID=2710758 RepID=A0A7S8ED71_9CHLR|nr:LysM peptidoglycan-binding domain-containing protein [Phototrophicus methaneseepsis]QPC84694.1 LysM peptidoglycan-binding domain-containing protein [Phototrophicus methaneseepsis]
MQILRKFSKGFFRLLLLSLMLVLTVPALAQETDLSAPDQIQYALDDLSTRTGQTVTLTTITSYTWQERQYSDSSLGCPQPGEMYAQVITPGYQFDVTYSGVTYDYRVSEDGSTVIMCGSETAQPGDPTAPDESPCGSSYTVLGGDYLYSIAVACNTTVDALMEANPEIENRSVIYPGQILQIPQGEDDTPATGEQSVSISPLSGPAGTQVEITASGFPANTQVEIGVGPYESEYSVIETTTTDANGNLVADGRIPSDVDAGDEWVFVVVLDNEETISEVFEVTTGTPTEEPDSNLFERTNIYLIALEDAGATGEEIGCGDSLVPVEVAIEPTIAPLTAALTYLFENNEQYYGQSGLYNPFYNSDLSVDGIDIIGGNAQIELSGELSLAGACDNPRIESILQQTALQYSTIDSVDITINGEPLDQLLSGA